MNPRRRPPSTPASAALSVGKPALDHIVIVGVHVASRIAKNIKIACCLSVRPSFKAMLIKKKKGRFVDLCFSLMGQLSTVQAGPQRLFAPFPACTVLKSVLHASD